mmetsp:Transcript_4459/g.11743  ORF Transcript_4459/g.11743 Transcript_4459/m.11743 type:complete len:202 (-) Transcript_4459:277-882(-)
MAANVSDSCRLVMLFLSLLLVKLRISWIILPTSGSPDRRRRSHSIASVLTTASLMGSSWSCSSSPPFAPIMRSSSCIFFSASAFASFASALRGFFSNPGRGSMPGPARAKIASPPALTFTKRYRCFHFLASLHDFCKISSSSSSTSASNDERLACFQSDMKSAICVPPSNATASHTAHLLKSTRSASPGKSHISCCALSHA